MASDYITNLAEIIRSEPRDSAQYQSALAELREWNVKASRTANSRMRSLEKSGYTQYAYGRAINYTQSVYGSNTFKGGKALSLSDTDLVDQALEIDTFIGRKTSTTQGARAMEFSRGQYLADTLGINIEQIARNKFGNTSKAKSAVNQFFRFLGTDTVASFLKDVSGYYKVVLEGVATVVADSKDRRSTVDQLIQSIEQYLAGEKRYDTLLNELGVSIDDLSDTRRIY